MESERTTQRFGRMGNWSLRIGRMFISRTPMVCIPKKLFSMEGYVNRFRFSPDGTKMRFSVNSKLSGQREIWETRGDGTGLTRALKELTQADGEPCCGRVWSADGRYYFFGATLNGASASLGTAATEFVLEQRAC